MIIAGIDAGIDTGVSIFSVVEGRKPKLFDYEVVRSYSILYEKLRCCDLIVYENYILYPWKAKQQYFKEFPASEVIGVLKLLAEKEKIKLIKQSAKEGKFYWNDNKLAKAGYYINNKHIRDSVRHVLHYLKFRYKKCDL